MKQFNAARFLYKLDLHVLLKPLSQAFILFIEFFDEIFNT